MTKVFAATLTLALAITPAMASDIQIPPASAVMVAKGKMLVASDGARLAPIYRVGDEGPQIILDGRMVTVPNATVAQVDGRLTTTLTKAQVIALP